MSSARNYHPGSNAVTASLKPGDGERRAWQAVMRNMDYNTPGGGTTNSGGWDLTGT